MELVLTLLVGALVGVVMGLLGAGGSLLTVPALILVLGLSAREATATSLVAVLLMAVSGVVAHRRAGRTSFRAGLTFGAAGVVTAAIAGWLASGLPDAVLTGLFLVVLAATLVWMLRSDDPRPPEEQRLVRVVSAGAGVGVLTGLLGVGGGFIIVPALVATLGLPMAAAVGTSQLVILTNVTSGLAVRSLAGGVLWGTGLLFGAGGAVGAQVGSRLAGRLAPRQMRLAFAAVAAIVAVALALREYGPL